MNRWIGFVATLVLLCAGLVLSQARKVDAPAAPNAVLYLVADTERELTRLPMAYTRISDADEIRIGDRIAGLEQPKLGDEDKLIEAYVQAVGGRLAANAHRRLPYKFHYIPQRYFINAFALPGGHVYIGAGLLALMNDEDELAAVLGHEIEHIDHYHCAERLQVEAALRKIPLGELAAIPIALFQAGYNKDQELEADREGTRLSVTAGYSPEGAIQVFAQFQKMEEQFESKPEGPAQEMSAAAIQVLTDYFRSHPPSSDRVAQIRSLIARENWPVGQMKPLQVRYIFLAYQAQDEVVAAHYDKATKAAEESLRLHPGYAAALVALAKARVAIRDFQSASAAYKELLAKYPNDADDVRTFTGQSAGDAMKAKQFTDAARLAGFSLELQPNNADALQLLAKADLELGDVNAALEAGQKLRKLYPGSGAGLLQYVNNAADQALQAHRYDRAARFSAYSLRLEPLQPEAQQQLARSEFDLGDFRAAANAYRTILEGSIRQKTALDPATLRGYADSLGSVGNHAEAAYEFRQLLRPAESGHSDLSFQVKIEHAGLLVMAGDESLAHSLVNPPIGAAPQSFAPEHIARLGWWYYRARKFDVADELLRRFLLVRPGDAGLQHKLAWVQLEKNAPAEALHFFETPAGPDEAPESLRVGQTIAQWRLRQTEPAMMAFEQMAHDAPQWTNPQWVSSFFGPAAAQSLQEMASEQQRRIAARRIR